MNSWTFAGMAIMVLSESATLAGIEPFASWNTPIAWTGFIVFADGYVWQSRRRSWIRSEPREFFWLAVVSIPLWLVFEWFNLFIENWYYTGLPERLLLRLFGYAWSFATIWPAIFEGADLIDVWRRPTPVRVASKSSPHQPLPLPLTIVGVVVGSAMLLWPVVWPSRYLAAPVWLGFILLLDPINAQLGAESLFRDVRHGHYDRLKNLVLSGFLCGVLWEFWNYWAAAKWHYTVPIMENLKIFEMPVPGYFGFPAFALECFTMYVFVRTVVVRAAARGLPLRSVGLPPPRLVTG